MVRSQEILSKNIKINTVKDTLFRGKKGLPIVNATGI